MADSTRWVAVDWGTSNLRLWGLDAAGAVCAEANSPKGMGKLTQDQFAPALDEALSSAGLSLAMVEDVVICGMAGARQGWIEAPYLDAPTDLFGLIDGAVAPKVSSGRVRILPGVCQKIDGAENVMRGEETQLLGLAHLVPNISGPVCMPGTHSKWAMVEGTRLTQFSTAMTGEMFDILSHHSVLRHSLGDGGLDEEREVGFDAGVERGLDQPEMLIESLFTVRAASLLSARSPAWCRGYLSGLLIGSEVGGKRSWVSSGAVVPLVGSPALCSLYAKAIGLAGGRTQAIDATEATLAGLKAARSFETP